LLHPRFQLNCEPEEKLSQSDIHLQRAIYAGYCADTCNLGWGASEMIKTYALLKGIGIEKPEYLRFATRICDFFTQHYSEQFGFGRAWTIEGECLDGQGTIGGFILAALLDVHRWTKNEDYLRCAQKALDFYFATGSGPVCLHSRRDRLRQRRQGDRLSVHRRQRWTCTN
jgi:hypothetical protein